MKEEKHYIRDAEGRCKHGKRMSYHTFPKMFKLCKCCGIIEEFDYTINVNFKYFINGYCSTCDEAKPSW